MFNSIRNAFTNKYVLWATVFVVYLLILTQGAGIGKLIGELAILLVLLAISAIVFTALGKSGKDLLIALSIFVGLAWLSDKLQLFELAGGIGYGLGSVVQGLTITGTCFVFGVLIIALLWMIYSNVSSSRQSAK